MKRVSWVEALLAALCLWAAWYHTPAGALVRTLGAWIFHAHTTARPLLAYYSAGVYGSAAAAPPQLVGPVPRGEALAYGIWAAGGQRGTPQAAASRLSELSQELGSDEAAVLAIFAGVDAAQYAVQRAHAEGAGLALPALVRELPPGFDDAASKAGAALMLGTAYALAWPLPETVRVTSPFGMRLHPTLGLPKLHAGVDLGTPVGTPVRATAPGLVRRAGSDAQNGNAVVVDHGRGVVTLYLHNDALLVHAGDHVTRGQIIARSGSTGRSTGPHLHYQLDLGGTPVDPLRYRAPKPVHVVQGAQD